MVNEINGAFSSGPLNVEKTAIVNTLERKVMECSPQFPQLSRRHHRHRHIFWFFFFLSFLFCRIFLQVIIQIERERERIYNQIKPRVCWLLNFVTFENGEYFPRPRGPRRIEVELRPIPPSALASLACFIACDYFAVVWKGRGGRGGRSRRHPRRHHRCRCRWGGGGCGLTSHYLRRG